MSTQSTLLSEVCGIPLGSSFVSPGRTVTEADIVAFAGVSGDFNELHTNAEYMKGTAYGQRIAHGLLVLSIASGLGIRALPKPLPVLAFLGIKEWNFRKPVFIGDTITVRLTLSGARATQAQDRVVVTWTREVRNQRGEVVQDGTTLLLVDNRPA